ncbi:MAG TPA: DUF1800 family protein, partial [Paracoccaceae bacterium]|nr:DUF1800 family protein [Paracoccaceae bacterium]
MSIGMQTIAAIRYGYGFRPGEAPPGGAKALLAGLEGPDAGAAPEVPETVEVLAGVRMRREARRAEKRQEREAEEMTRAARQMVRAISGPLMLRRIAAPVLSPQGFRERLVTFWADHFTVAAKGPQLKVLAPHHVEAAIRPHVAGRFRDLLAAAELHPAMLVYLNQTESIGPSSRAARGGEKGLNENLAREILELHTLGVDASYDQDDV